MDAVFDIEDNKFIKRPEDFTFDKSMYMRDFERKVQEIDVVKGELKRDIIDYRELEGLTSDDVLNLQELINEKLDEIEDSIRDIIKIGDGVDADRRLLHLIKICHQMKSDNTELKTDYLKMLCIKC